MEMFHGRLPLLLIFNHFSSIHGSLLRVNVYWLLYLGVLLLLQLDSFPIPFISLRSARGIQGASPPAPSSRVAAHQRSYEKGRFTTLEEHRPKSHQKHLQWTPGRLVAWAQTVGPHCAQVIERILQSKPHPEQGYRSCLGIMRLGKALGAPRVEAACVRALHFGTCSYTSIHSILRSKLDGQPLEQELPLTSPVHENLRGSPYYA